MKTHAASTSIDQYHGAVQHFKTDQQVQILAVMQPGIPYTGQELSHLTGLTPNVISARLFELRELSLVTRPEEERKVCPWSHVSVKVHRKIVTELPLGQMDLLQ